jgi:hypothetical protein
MKKKLRLHLKDLDVEQFEVEHAVVADRGTVEAHQASTSPCTNYCGASTNANTAPCLLCPEMPITWSCEAGECW